MSQYTYVIGFVMLLVVPLRTLGQYQPGVRSVEIKSSWKSAGGGIVRANPPATKRSESSEITIRKEGDKYEAQKTVLDGNLLTDHQAVDADQIAVLVKALKAPVIPEIRLEGLGITPEWLKAHASSVAQRLVKPSKIYGVPARQAMLEYTFADPVEVNKVLPGLFDSRRYRCADCTRFFYYVEIVVTFDDSSALTARSASQFPLMLPWRVITSTPGSQTFNGDISRAVAALLPENATNRSRLTGEDLDIKVGGELLGRLRHQEQLSEVESQTGETFAALRSKYSIESASIGTYEDPGGRKPETALPEEPALLLHLEPSDPPHNFFEDEVTLCYQDGNVVGADKFLEDGPQLEKLVLSVPWLNQYAQEHPGGRFGLAFVCGASFSDQAMKAFAADMRAIGRDRLIPKVEAAKSGIALLRVGSGVDKSDWLVLPDRHMVLWRYTQIPLAGAKPNLLKWSDTPPYKKPCAKVPNGNFGGCVGAEISPDGTLLPLK